MSVKLTKKQLTTSILDELKKEDGLNSVFKMTLEALMLLERQEFASGDLNNKGNGYSYKKSLGFGSGFRLSVLRDRLGVFFSVLFITKL